MNTLARRSFLAFVIGGMLLLLSACSIDVDDKKNDKVDIKTPFANLKVDGNEKAVNNGIPVYPGAHLRPKENGDTHSANIDIGAIGFGLKVIAAEYETDDPPAKVKAFYEDKMKSFGEVMVCNGHDSDNNVHISGHKDDTKLSCDDSKGDGWEIKTGRNDNEHMVSIEPHGSGTRFGTVFIQTRGKSEDTL